MLRPDLSVLLTLSVRFGRPDLELELVGEDVYQLCTIAILTANNLLLSLVVVPAGEEVAEDHLRNPHLLLCMLLDRNAIAIVLHGNDQGLSLLLNRDSNVLDGICRGNRTNTSISSIYHQLIKELVEARIEGDLAVNHLLSVEDPTPLIVRFHRPYVGIWKLKDVLAVRELLVRRCNRHVWTGKGGGLPYQLF